MTETPEGEREFPEVSSEKQPDGSYHITVRRAPHYKAQFRLLAEEVEPVSDHLHDLLTGKDREADR